MTYVDKFCFHERVVDIAWRQKDDGKSDKGILVPVVQRFGSVSRQEFEIFRYVVEQVLRQHFELEW